MSAASLTWSRPSFEVISNVTSSLGSVDGPSRSDLPDGQTTLKFGQGAAHVNRSARRAKEKEFGIGATSGPLFETSSPHAALQLSLESKLRAMMDTGGSPEYGLTWVSVDMPSGPPICRLRALAHRTSGKGYSGWPSPQAHDTHERGNTMADHHHYPHDLSNAVAVVGWSGPNWHDGRRPGADLKSTQGTNLSRDVVLLTGWATPLARDWCSESATVEFNERRWNHLRGKPLPVQVLAGWNTPTTPRPHDSENTVGIDYPSQHQNDLGRQASLFGAKTTNGGGYRLNPGFSLWLMLGTELALELLSCAPRATRSSLKLRQSSSKQ